MLNPISTFLSPLLLALILALPFWTPALAQNAQPLNASCQGVVAAKEGSCAPNISLELVSGPKVTLYKGGPKSEARITLVHFWATWCEPCRDELPLLADLLKSLSGKKIDIVTISLDDDLKTIESFFKALPGPANALARSLPIYLDSSRLVAGHYGTFKVPESFIIGKDGRVLDKIVGSYPWRDTLVAHYLELLSKSSP